jgi:hypothetical protein
MTNLHYDSKVSVVIQYVSVVWLKSINKTDFLYVVRPVCPEFHFSLVIFEFGDTVLQNCYKLRGCRFVFLIWCQKCKLPFLLFVELSSVFG